MNYSSKYYVHIYNISSFLKKFKEEPKHVPPILEIYLNKKLLISLIVSLKF